VQNKIISCGVSMVIDDSNLLKQTSFSTELIYDKMINGFKSTKLHLLFVIVITLKNSKLNFSFA
jgi:hypothetical protein